MTAVEDTRTTEIALARECLYRFLSASLGDPHSGRRVLQDAENCTLAEESADLLREEAESRSAPLGFGELPAEELNVGLLLAGLEMPFQEICAQHDRIFGLTAFRECPPYETEYQPNCEPFFRSQQMADIAGFYRAFGLTPASTRMDRPDHLALELEFMAFLLMKRRLAAAGSEHCEVCEKALESFFRDHIIWWAPSFATGLRRLAQRGFYNAVGRVLSAFLASERVRFGIAAQPSPVQPIPGDDGRGNDGECGSRGTNS